MKALRALLPLRTVRLLAGALLYPLVAAATDLADAPVLLLQGADPNLIFTLDDSETMGLAYLPDSVGATAGSDSVNTLRVKSASFNKIHYNPAVIYAPPRYGDATLPNASFTAVCLNPFAFYDPLTNTVSCPDDCKLNLSTQYRSPFSEYESGGADPAAFCTWGTEAQVGRDPLLPEACEDPTIPIDPACQASAFYYVLRPACQPDAECANSDANYQRVDVAEAEKQNFANWFAYYRNRFLLAKTAVSVLAAQISAEVRVGYQGLYSISFEHEPVPVPNLALTGVSPFSGGARSDFFDWLFTAPPKKPSTPTIQSLIRVADYLSSAEPYRVDPSDDTSRLDECRRNFHVVFTDGGWTDSLLQQQRLSEAGWVDYQYEVPDVAMHNWDSEVNDDIGYVVQPPYADDNIAGLADVAFYYWSHDLLDDDVGPDTVPPLIRDHSQTIDDFHNPRNDPATWQHIVNYTVGLGASGHLAYTGDTFPPAIFAADSAWSAQESFDMTMLVEDPDILPVLWAPAIPSNEALVDDLWHAAVNSRGLYFSAQDIGSLRSAFESVLGEIGTVTKRGGGASAAVTAGTLSTSTKLFHTSYDSTDWSGELRAYNVSTGPGDERPGCGGLQRGTLCAGYPDDPEWRAEDLLDEMDPADRMIVTFDGANGVPFEWDNLSVAQRGALKDGDLAPVGQARLAYLRGNRSCEAEGGCEVDVNGNGVVGVDETLSLRPRGSVLGDIVDSAPLFVGKPARLYGDGYGDWAGGVDRPDMVYVGANDGMLHAFDADTGEERFAYIPGLVLDKLADLTDPDYTHQYSVNGQLAEGDVKVGDDWKTLLAGGLGKGAQGVFALDITDPAPGEADTEGTVATARHPWEFSDADDRDLGYVYGAPVIAKICTSLTDGSCTSDNQQWVVLVGNGYNNTATGAGETLDPDNCVEPDPEEDDSPGSVSCTGDAVLYVLNAADGSLIKAIRTGEGKDWDPSGMSQPNGLGKPVVVDNNGDLIGDVAYVGDLFGNLWWFDLTNINASPRRLFHAVDANGNAQPITAPVAVERHPTGFGTLVLFGTGKLLGSDDVSDTQTQTFYGIWDDGTTNADSYTRGPACAAEPNDTAPDAAAGPGQLLAQCWKGGIRSVGDSSQARLSTNRTIDSWGMGVGQSMGWYLDLNFTSGERVVAAPAVRGGRVVFVSTIPSLDPCVAGGESWVNALDAKDGSRMPQTPFDYDLNGGFGIDDLFVLDPTDPGSATVAGTSMRLIVGGSTTGVYSAPTTQALEGGTTMLYVSSSEGEIITLRESSALQWRVWQQLR